jgi:hypothetical protein
VAGTLGGGAGDPGVPTINAKNVDGGPLRGGAGGSRAPPPTQKTLMTAPGRR